MAKVTGIGGVFFKCSDTAAANDWYKTKLGMDVGPYGANFEWREHDDPSKVGSTAWNLFPDTTKFFEPSEKGFMVNYRVDDLAGLIEQLKADGVTVLDEIAEYPYGKFAHILDLEGNKIQLWEPTEDADSDL